MSKIERTCTICGKSFWVQQGRLKHGRGQTCSRACQYRSVSIKNSTKDRDGYTAPEIVLICKVCNKPFALRPSDYNYRVKIGEPPQYCSRKCAHASPEWSANLSRSLKNSQALKESRAHTIPKMRATKNTPEYRQKSRIYHEQQMTDPEKRERWQAGIKRRSHNPKWRDAPTHRQGAANPNYKGGKSRERAILISRYEYKQWRKEVFKRDKYTCQRCHVHGTDLVAHHIKPWAEYPDLRFDVSNGVTLCEHCHDLEHGKVRKPKTYKCVDCGKPKNDGRQPRCRSCGAKFGSKKRYAQ